MTMNNLSRAAVAAFALSLGVLACGDKEKEAAQAAAAASAKTAEEATKAAEEAKKKAEEEAKAAAAKVTAEAVNKVQKELDAADRKFTYLKDKAAKATAAQKKNADAAVAEVDKRREAVKSAIEKLAAGGDDWEGLKTAVESALGELTKAIDGLEAVFAKK